MSTFRVTDDGKLRRSVGQHRTRPNGQHARTAVLTRAEAIRAGLVPGESLPEVPAFSLTTEDGFILTTEDGTVIVTEDAP